ncbi:hypothetical protein CL1_1079 [Thermococcus cleftensis]|uniref:PLD phosphodiesterase domain-containing protein n=1 Tax=Thermococcus cleftensis (strain DSM 27260 / KACC 17922 / CL1) TaxID=163003 RepID=I3ZU98_THECF|nr:phospholipase D family protein [Thermococcus cleftensis]AFL95282.1 hypothetical protein CL1_1079 [Thermococcus cleftensis]
MSRNVKILTTGNHLKSRNFRNIETVIQELFDDAHEQIHLVTYVITDNTMWLIDMIEKSLRRGRFVKLIVNELNPSLKVTQKLFQLKKHYENFILVEFSKKYPGETIHAKTIVVDRRKAVIGSMNFTWGGMVGNHEIGVLIEGPEIEDLAYALDML